MDSVKHSSVSAGGAALVDAVAQDPRFSRVPRDADGRLDIKSLSADGIADLCECVGLDRATGRRVFKAVWQQGARSIGVLDQVNSAARKRLAHVAYVSWLEPALVLRSDDGSTKFLWKLHDGHTIESVLIPDGDRVTLCISSQVGCAMACAFCLTGDLGLIRHLSPAEIANQPLQVGLQLPDGQRITNLVLMGMGEPLHNLDNLTTALSSCLHDHGLNFSHRRVTVSTVGLVPKLAELAARLPVNLAVSLNATTEEQRRQIMPVTKKWSMASLLDACRAFPLPNGKRITFEYVMFQGFNDSLDDAARLLTLLAGIPSKVNLIPYNENPDRAYRRPDAATVKAFQHHLVSNGMSCTVRTTRGIDISAACGQLGKAWAQAETAGWLADARRIAGFAAPIEVTT